MEEQYALIKRIKENSIRMMMDRGYTEALYHPLSEDIQTLDNPSSSVESEELNYYLGMNTEEFYNFLQEKNRRDDDDDDEGDAEDEIHGLNQIYIHPHTQRKAYIIFISDNDMNSSSDSLIKYIRKILNKKDHDPFLSHPITGIDTFLFISNDTLNKDKIITIKGLLLKIKNVQFFVKKELYMHVISGKLVPKHVPMSHIQARRFLKMNKLSADQLPKIAYDDPITKHYGLLPGQIFKIYRIKCDVPGFITNSITYRYVYNRSIQTIDS
uniref:DNA-directed RNA polymerase subunit 5 n=1 Tax=Pithovirus LCPAC101 TaxID=2506586 RepID=A0A481Z4C6_9VIRU|nr:MAG: DNA-directed RNA polymerase subunit 5 [Pithovirus LCPAC101]